MNRRQFLSLTLGAAVIPPQPERQWTWTDDRWQRVHYTPANTVDIGMPIRVWDADGVEWKRLIYLNARTGEGKTFDGACQLKMPIVVWTVGEKTTPQIRRLIK